MTIQCFALLVYYLLQSETVAVAALVAKNLPQNLFPNGALFATMTMLATVTALAI